MSAPAGTTPTPTSTTSSTRTPRMTLWRLELARLLRTFRWMILFGVYALFGALGAVTARYFNEIVERFGEGMIVQSADPRPADGIVQFVGNASQLGLLAVVVVAASALAIDARPEVAAFLRTRVQPSGRLVVYPYVVTTAAAVVALVLGTGVAWALTAALIGSLPASGVVVGTVYGAASLAFAVAVVAAVAGFTRGQAVTVFGGLGFLLLVPAIGVIDPVQPWLPSQLLTAVAATVQGAPAGDFARALAVTAVTTPALLALAWYRFDRREQ